MRMIPLSWNQQDELLQLESENSQFPKSQNWLISCEQHHYSGYCLYEATRLVGYLVYQQLPEGMELIQILVHSETRGRGFGEKLMAKLLEVANSSGTRFIWLEVRAGNLSAIGLYEKMGFVKQGIRRGYFPGKGSEPPEDAILMQWSADYS